uniref:Folylpolyglutamate synthase n=2 Tax=Haemonchus contortus TaxID=6289 RepID=A0A7I4XZX7_HAECO
MTLYLAEETFLLYARISGSANCTVVGSKMHDRFAITRIGRLVASVNTINAICRRGPHLLVASQSTTMIPSAFSQTLAKELPQNPYEVAVLHLNSLQSNAITLQKLRQKRNILQETNIPNTIFFLNKCGIELNQLDGLNIIHVSGTKGKGSTCAFVESILRKAGYRTGLYTSPHLVTARERIRINGKPISEALFAKHFFTVYDKLKKDEDSDGMPAYFKFLTLLSFHVFLEESVDVAIVEVGIGGEYDCTNIIPHPVVCGISTLDIDHTSILGSTLPSIAWNKAGILKDGTPAVMTPAPADALSVIEDRSLERGAVLRKAPPYESYSFATGTVSAGIDGEHQKVNISLALQLTRAWLKRMGREEDVYPEACENEWHIGQPFSVPQLVVEGIESCRWPGRSQIVNTERITYYLDGAHTPKSMEMCSLWFGKAVAKTPKMKRVLVFHCTADRKPSTLLPYLSKHSFDYALFCPTALKVSPDLKSDLTNINQSLNEQLVRSHQCAAAWKELGTGEISVFDCVTSAVEHIEHLSRKETLDVFVTGSLHLVGGVLSLIEPSID